MRRFIVISALLLAGCDSGPQWENEQDELGNELNETAPPAAEDPNILSETDYLNTTEPVTNDVNATAPVFDNEVTPP